MRHLMITLATLASLLLAGCQPSTAAARHVVTATPFQPEIVTTTPYLPLHPTRTPQAIQAEELPYLFHDIDFSPGAGEITLRFWPAVDSFNRGKPIKVRFLPGSECNFGDHQACVTHFRTDDNQIVIWVSVHSGFTGEGQELRHALEGTGINSAGVPLDQVRDHLLAFEKAAVTLQQGQSRVDTAQIAAAARIPAARVADYLSKPLDQALDLLFDQDAAMPDSIQPGKPILIIETCGWRMPGEPGGEAVTDTTASIYIGVLQ